MRRHSYSDSCWLLFNLLFYSVQPPGCVWLFATPWTAARQASPSLTISWSLHTSMSIESVMPSIHLILRHPLLLLPSIFPSIGSFPMSWFIKSGVQRIGASAPASVFPMTIQGWFPLGLTALVSLHFKESSPAPQFKDINSLVSILQCAAIFK